MHILLLLFGILGLSLAETSSGRVSGTIGSTEVLLKWVTDYDEQLAHFSVWTSGPELEWIGIGFSDHGMYNKSDICVFYNKHLRDYHILGNYRMEVDRSQDCQLIDNDQITTVASNGYHKMFEFKRRFTTCDPNDYSVEPGTTQFIFAGGDEFTLQFDSPMVKKSLHYAQVIDHVVEDTKLESDAKTFQVLAEEAEIPNVVTSYWCIIKEIPLEVQEKKHHIVKMNAVVQKGNEHIVHHMVIYACQDDNQVEFSSNCNDAQKPESARSCSHVIGAWSMGAAAVSYPSDAGLPLGGPNSHRYVMVEMHYNNVEKISGRIDSSGFEFTVTPSLRRYDSGIMELGLVYSDANSIPPGQQAFPITAYCVEDCTNKLPEGGIHIFASQLHAHLTGRKLWTSHYRNGVKIGELNRDDHYSPHWQHVQQVRPYMHLEQGDVLATTCVYETKNRDKITLGGYGIEDEMCVNYIYYYPVSEVEVCKSAIDNTTLHRYFKNRYNIPKHDLRIDEKYKRVDWSQENADSLRELYATAPLNMHCLQSDGNLFPNHPTNWTKVPTPTVFSGPFVKKRDHYECPALNDF